MKYFTEIKMKEEEQRKLFQKYPKIFHQRSLPMSETAMCWGFSCGSGWYNIIDALCANIQSYIDSENKPQIEATQVKEKFGELRFYTNIHVDEYIEALINMAESMSRRTCESCGAPGVQTNDGWIITLCDPCREKHYRRWREEDLERRQLSFKF